MFEEHKNYIDALISSGLHVKILEELNEYPDSIFIEDPAIVYEDVCVLLRPGVKTRLGESKSLENEAKKYFEKVFIIKDGKIEGGDILRINNHFIIGLSERTNKKGAENLSSILKKFGAKIKENNDNNNVVLKGVLNTLDKLDEKVDELSGIVKEEIRIEKEKTKPTIREKS